MKIIVGSQSERKLASVRKVLAGLDITAEVIGVASNSGVPPTPWDEQTHDGARNRARDCRQHDLGADFYLGLESGLVIRYGEAYEEAWASVVNTAGREWLGYSSGLRLPQLVVDAMNKSGQTHQDVMTLLRQSKGVPGNSKDTWGDYTGGLILRDVSLEEALRNAFIQALAPAGSLYAQAPEPADE